MKNTFEDSSFVILKMGLMIIWVPEMLTMNQEKVYLIVFHPISYLFFYATVEYHETEKDDIFNFL